MASSVMAGLAKLTHMKSEQDFIQGADQERVYLSLGEDTCQMNDG
jgi:hypothetical protein